ncbi:MAG: hypothetical protein GWN01_01355 [Nitrosopumilaceae archaeon]|nr:hypothetical protein [Nitrosopumilaceae archaeon]NIU86006.1 hypothetical protein [Nitrosopumilaceae archaeon]NIX60225.1 hypothetical protein [Nitrosopumilaceae archaeon]
MKEITRFLVNNKKTPLLSAEVNVYGDRSVDSSKFRIPPQTSVTKKDQVSYVQDIVDTTFLTAIWNFQYSARDESGYDIDGDDGTYTADFTADTTRKYTENIQPVIRFNADGEKVTVADNSRFDFSKQFDIIVITTPETASTTARTVFSKSNGGVGGGIEIGVSGADPGYIDVELIDTDGTFTQITGTNVNLRDGNYHFLRVKRDENGDIEVSTDGTVEGTANKNTSKDDYTASGVDLLIGKNFGAGSKHYRGNVAQIRVYSGGYLSDRDFTKVLNSKRQAQTMKFRGTISNIDNNNGIKRVYAKSINDELSNTKISKEIMDARDDSADGNGIDNVFLDDATNRMRTTTIIEKILAQVDSEYVFNNASDDGAIMNRYVARGSFIQIIKQLFTLDNRQFWMTPRKVIVRENQPITTKYSLHDDNHDMSVDAHDDTNLFNDIEGVGEVQIHQTTEKFSGDGATTEFSLSNTPVTTKVTVDGTEKIRGIDSSDSTSKDYYIEYTDGASVGARLVFFSAPASGTDNIEIECTYEATGTLYFRANDSTSITNNGRVSGRVYTPGFDQNQIATFLTNLLNDLKDIKQRVDVQSPKLINFLRVGLECTIVDDIKAIDSLFTLKSIHYLYPDGITRLRFGEHEFDYFDIMQIENERIGELGTSLIKTNNL